MVKEDLRQKLKKKGWTTGEIDHIEEIFSKAHAEKPKHIHFIDASMYWIALFLALLGNFVMSIIIIPVLLILSGFWLYLSLFILGMCIGGLLQLLLRDIERHAKTHHILVGLFLPMIALINIYLITELSNFMARVWDFTHAIHQPFFVSIIYVIAFLVPYGLSVLHKYTLERPLNYPH